MLGDEVKVGAILAVYRSEEMHDRTPHIQTHAQVNFLHRWRLGRLRGNPVLEFIGTTHIARQHFLDNSYKDVPGRNLSTESTPTGGWYQNEPCMHTI